MPRFVAVVAIALESSEATFASSVALVAFALAGLALVLLLVFVPAICSLVPGLPANRAKLALVFAFAFALLVDCANVHRDHTVVVRPGGPHVGHKLLAEGLVGSSTLRRALHD